MPDPPPLPNPNVSSFYHYPKKKAVKGRHYWGSEFLGQLERKKKSKQSLDVIETKTQEVKQSCLPEKPLQVVLPRSNTRSKLLQVVLPKSLPLSMVAKLKCRITQGAHDYFLNIISTDMSTSLGICILEKHISWLWYRRSMYPTLNYKSFFLICDIYANTCYLPLVMGEHFRKGIFKTKMADHTIQ